MVQMMPYNKNLRVPLDVASVGSLNPFWNNLPDCQT